MSSPITQQMHQDGPNIYYQPEFRDMVEDHLNWLITHPDTTTIDILPKDAFKYEGDFYGLMAQIDNRRHLFWYVMRINRMKQPEDFTRDTVQLLIPDTALLDRLVKTFKTTNRQL
ncbi:hypothetical protein [Endozoicomonas sp. ONNA1]|uniref:hypothetical protein n=1 Tax=Endozoicomonas sp. ONNA1 TaxID=2828740 RepID=UPI0021487E47|nr:hypothetical protein [Endozoicomonas sp. ONNA1]